MDLYYGIYNYFDPIEHQIKREQRKIKKDISRLEREGERIELSNQSKRKDAERKMKQDMPTAARSILNIVEANNRRALELNATIQTLVDASAQLDGVKNATRLYTIVDGCENLMRRVYNTSQQKTVSRKIHKWHTQAKQTQDVNDEIKQTMASLHPQTEVDESSDDMINTLSAKVGMQKTEHLPHVPTKKINGNSIEEDEDDLKRRLDKLTKGDSKHSDD